MPPKKTVVASSESLRFARAVPSGLRARASSLSRSLFAILCVLLLNACESPASENELSFDLSDIKREGSSLSVVIDIEISGRSVFLSAELVNSSDQEIKFLPWGTPFEGAVTADFLRVREEGKAEDVLYTGIMIKRRPPKFEDYKSVKPGDSLTGMVDISKSYILCPNRQYEIAYSGALVSPKGDTFSIKTNTVKVLASNNLEPCR